MTTSRRSLLGLIGLAPIVGPKIAAATYEVADDSIYYGITKPFSRAGQIEEMCKMMSQAVVRLPSEAAPPASAKANADRPVRAQMRDHDTFEPEGAA